MKMDIDSFAAYDIALNNYDFDRIVAGHPSVRSDSLLSSLNPFLAPGVKVLEYISSTSCRFHPIIVISIPWQHT
jgi:hypothetical protein